MTAARIRVYCRDQDGSIGDTQLEFGLDAFAGHLPTVGDLILEPYVPSHLDRSDPANRRIWQVVGRVFNPRDSQEAVVLVVEERPPTKFEFDLVP